MMPANETSRAPVVEVHITELLLQGFASRDKQRIGAALSAELERLLATEGIPASLQQTMVIDALEHDDGSFDINDAARPETIGQRAAHAIYARLKR